jgi:hypothetical protein
MTQPVHYSNVLTSRRYYIRRDVIRTRRDDSRKSRSLRG